VVLFRICGGKYTWISNIYSSFDWLEVAVSVLSVHDTKLIQRYDESDSDCAMFLEAAARSAPFQSRHSQLSKPGQFENLFSNLRLDPSRLFLLVTGYVGQKNTFFKIIIFGR
jgi:hypothetical protein